MELNLIVDTILIWFNISVPKSYAICTYTEITGCGYVKAQIVSNLKDNLGPLMFFIISFAVKDSIYSVFEIDE